MSKIHKKVAGAVTLGATVLGSMSTMSTQANFIDWIKHPIDSAENLYYTRDDGYETATNIINKICGNFNQVGKSAERKKILKPVVKDALKKLVENEIDNIVKPFRNKKEEKNEKKETSSSDLNNATKDKGKGKKEEKNEKKETSSSDLNNATKDKGKEKKEEKNGKKKMDLSDLSNVANDEASDIHDQLQDCVNELLRFSIELDDSFVKYARKIVFFSTRTGNTDGPNLDLGIRTEHCDYRGTDLEDLRKKIVSFADELKKYIEKGNFKDTLNSAKKSEVNDNGVKDDTLNDDDEEFGLNVVRTFMYALQSRGVSYKKVLERIVNSEIGTGLDNKNKEVDGNVLNKNAGKKTVKDELIEKDGKFKKGLFSTEEEELLSDVLGKSNPVAKVVKVSAAVLWSALKGVGDFVFH